MAKEIADKIDMVLKQLDQLLTDSQREEFYQNLQNIFLYSLPAFLLGLELQS